MCEGISNNPVLLYYCITVLLYYCITVLLYYCITVLLYYCITVLLYYCITVYRTIDVGFVGRSAGGAVSNRKALILPPQLQCQHLPILTLR